MIFTLAWIPNPTCDSLLLNLPNGLLHWLSHSHRLQPFLFSLFSLFFYNFLFLMWLVCVFLGFLLVPKTVIAKTQSEMLGKSFLEKQHLPLCFLSDAQHNHPICEMSWHPDLCEEWVSISFGSRHNTRWMRLFQLLISLTISLLAWTNFIPFNPCQSVTFHWKVPILLL